MKIIGNILGLSVLVCFFIGIASFVIYVAKFIVAQLAIMDTSHATFAALAICTAIVCALIVARGLGSHKRDQRALLTKKKIEAYEQLLDELHPCDSVHCIADETKHRIMLFGSSSVLNVYAVLCDNSTQAVSADEQLQRLIKEIRSDLRVLNVGLSSKTIMTLLKI